MLFLTIVIACVLMAFVVLALGIGRLLTGKNRLKKGCGMTPKGKGHCDLCGSSKPCEEDNDDHKDETTQEHRRQDRS